MILRICESGRELRALVQRGEIRTAQLHGQEWLVVPVVALTEGVIHASNADENELVLASEFSRDLGQWAGRPVMADHPVVDGVPVRANTPEVLEGRQLGLVYKPRVEGRSLKMEAWLDRRMLVAAGQEALEERLRDAEGDPVEVSVGVLVEAEEKTGERDGKRYAAVWRRIVPDHLAILPPGKPGACSVKMGCGAPRLNAARSVDEDYRALWPNKDGEDDHGRGESGGGNAGEKIFKEREALDDAGAFAYNGAFDSAFASLEDEFGGDLDPQQHDEATLAAHKAGMEAAAKASKDAARGKTVLNKAGKDAINAKPELSPREQQRARIKETMRKSSPGYKADKAGARKVSEAHTAKADKATTVARSKGTAAAHAKAADEHYFAAHKAEEAGDKATAKAHHERGNEHSIAADTLRGDNGGPAGGNAYQVSKGSVGGRKKRNSSEGGMRLRERIAAFFGRLEENLDELEERTAGDGASTRELQDELWTALYNVVPAFGGIVDIYPDSGAVVYSTMEGASARSGPSSDCLWRRTYEVVDGEARLNDDAVRVERTVSYEPDEDADHDEEKYAAAHDCGCGGKKEGTGAAHGCGCAGMKSLAAKGEDDMSKKAKELVAKILAHKGAPFLPADAGVLEQLPEERLTAIEARCAAAAEEEETPEEKEKKAKEKEKAEGTPYVPKVASAAPVALTREQVYEAFPDIAGVVAEKQARDAARKDELVGSLKALGAYTEDELKAMSLQTLEGTARVASAASKAAGKKPVDFSGGAGSARGASSGAEAVPPPPSLKDRLAAARK